MRLFVTGVTGFVGRAFCRAALGHGHQVLGLCRDMDARIPERCRPAWGTLEEVPWKEIENFSPDVALHLAWIATPGVYLTSPDNILLLEQSRRLLRGLMDRGLKYIAGVGTCIEYASSAKPLNEIQSLSDPQFPYSRAKDQLFRWLRDEATARAIEWTWFRLFYPYGPGEHSSRLPTNIIRNVQQGQHVVLETPHSRKDYIYISDLADALCRGIQARISGPVNVGSGNDCSIQHLAQTIVSLLGASSDLIRVAEILGRDPNPVVVADISKLRTTGWKPATTLDDGLQKLIDSFRGSV